MRLLLTGATGLIGSELIGDLHSHGYDIRCLQRNKAKNAKSFWNTNEVDPNDGEPFSAVIHLAGENVAKGRWTRKLKERILQSRVEGTRQLVDYLATLTPRPESLLCASAVGYYGNRGDEALSETSGLGGGFLADVCKQWEAESRRAEKLGVRVINLRFGMVLSPNGGALHKMLPPFKAGLGGPIGKGETYMSWVSVRDIAGIVNFILSTNTLKGPVNVVSPHPVTNREFTEALAKVVGKPARLPAPPFALRLIFGEMADEMLLTSCRVYPDKLRSAGYVFQDTSLTETLRSCISNR